ncbi:pyridoxamine 5'-phosphate oxidase family protein [Nocardia arizonensis]|uniref:pyridoxamine 5'-phosphate oxidase family protein n=1 Tax=Nocardia arizonensis TaxID=1141647 RepID=UPI0006D265A5|nr:pyridoxamine 5'-phosphate oxidase family protein [Nocardia arizonensis]
MSPFHSGELAVQRRMGQADIAERVGRTVRADIPDIAADFLADQPMVVLAAADDHGRIWAGQLTGRPGFVRALDDSTIAVDARPAPDDPLAAALVRPRRVGMIALQPHRRRRMRVNGLAVPVESGMRITVDQVYSNCPKYISRREVRSYTPDEARPGSARSASLGTDQLAVLAATDAFFVATANGAGDVDASHRGGNPGFLRALSPSLLRWPDYRGNSMFMTLGNIAVNPRCGLLIPDWSDGGALRLTGRAALNWESDTFTPGAQCSIDFTVEEVLDSRGSGPLRWGPPELSPVNP